MGHGEHLRELVRSLGWSYAVVWSIPPLMTELVWTDGWYDTSSLKLNVERMFNASYKTCSFAPGAGYVGNVFSQGQHIWLTGNAVRRQSITPGQAMFFHSAGIQTLLCFPWFDGVVELGAERLVPQNEELLQRIRRFLSNIPTFKLQQQQQHLKIPGSGDSCHNTRFNSLSPSQGPQGVSSDEAEGGGLSDTTLNHPVDSCSSLEDKFLHQHFRLTPMAGVDGSCFWTESPAAVGAENLFPLHGKSSASLTKNAVVTGGANGVQHQQPAACHNGMIRADWRLDFGSDISTLTSSPTSTLQQVFTSLPHEDFESSSFLVSSSAQPSSTTTRSLSQATKSVSLQQQMTAKTSSSSMSGEISSHEQQIRGFLSPKNTASPGFKPWKGQKHVIGVKRQKNQSNQVLLQQSIRMVHQISLLKQKKDEKKRNEHMALSVRRASSEAREVHSCHDEAAINHMLAERKRREKQKENFSALRSLIPFVSKMDRASILGDAIQYVKQLKLRVQELESLNRELEAQIPNSQRKPNSPV